MAPCANPTDQQSDNIIMFSSSSSSSSQQCNDDHNDDSDNSDIGRQTSVTSSVDQQKSPVSPQSVVICDLTKTTTTTIPVAKKSSSSSSRRNIIRHPSQKKTSIVTFNKRVSFKYIKHIDEYTDEEYFATWYVEEDLKEIFNDCVDNVRKMVNGQTLDESKGYCSRGLEYKTPTGSKARKQNKLRGVTTVLEEQERQRELRIHNPELIAKLYYMAGADSRNAYRFLAMQDEHAARPIIQSKSSIATPSETTTTINKGTVVRRLQNVMHHHLIMNSITVPLLSWKN